MALIDHTRIQRGDILLERFHLGFNSHPAILAGQIFGLRGRHRDIMHAAVYTGDGEIVESVAEGLNKAELLEVGKPLLHWDVYHFHKHPKLRQAAAATALEFWDIAQASHKIKKGGKLVPSFGRYKKGAATRSAMSRFEPSSGESDALVKNYMEKMNNNDLRRRQFFCTNFVVLVWQLACEAVQQNPSYAIPLHYQRVSPADLANALSDNEAAHGGTELQHWSRVGQIRAAYAEVG